MEFAPSRPVALHQESAVSERRGEPVPEVGGPPVQARDIFMKKHLQGLFKRPSSR